MSTIFVVDDDVAILESMQLLLEMNGYHVYTNAGQDVITHLKAAQADLVLLDVWMGDTDGRDICEQIKADPDLVATPTILVSASKDNKTTCELVGADGYLEKPFDIDQVVEMVEACLQNGTNLNSRNQVLV